MSRAAPASRWARWESQCLALATLWRFRGRRRRPLSALVGLRRTGARPFLAVSRQTVWIFLRQETDQLFPQLAAQVERRAGACRARQQAHLYAVAIGIGDLHVEDFSVPELRGAHDLFCLGADALDRMASSSRIGWVMASCKPAIRFDSVGRAARPTMMPAMPADANRLTPNWRTASIVISAAATVTVMIRC